MKPMKSFFLYLIFLFPAAVFAACGSCGDCPSVSESCSVPGVQSVSSCSMGSSCSSGKSVDSCSSGGSCETTSPPVPSVPSSLPTIDTPGLAVLLQSKVPLVLLDARSGKYDDGRRIPGARALNPESEPNEVTKVVPSKETLIVTYCAGTKCPASHKLFLHLRKLGYTNLLEYPSGIEGWVQSGHKVVKSGL